MHMILTYRESLENNLTLICVEHYLLISKLVDI